MPDAGQHTLSDRATRLDEIEPVEPVVDGVPQVLVSSSTNSRTSYHKQDPHNAGVPKCGQQLRAQHTTWKEKPKPAMRRACDPCPACYPDGD